MKLEDQVCSLELAKKLKELGVEQDSLWWWDKIKDENDFNLTSFRFLYPLLLDEDNREYYSAFTVAELGNMFPSQITREVTCINKEKRIMPCEFMESKVKGKWIVEYLGKGFIDESEANARAKMLIYLIENKYIKV